MLARIPGKCFNGFNDEIKPLMLLESGGMEDLREKRGEWNEIDLPRLKAVFPMLTRSSYAFAPASRSLGQLSKYASLNYCKLA